MAEQRRLYIHGAIVWSIAKQNSSVLSQLAIEADIGCRISRAANHQFGDIAVDLGLLDEGQAVALLEAFRPAVLEPMARLLRGFDSSRTWSPHRVLLEADEVIFNNCFYDGYFTFATGRDAASAMFADDRPIRRLYTQQYDEGLDDNLVIYRPRDVALRREVDSTVGSVRAAVAALVRQLRAAATVDAYKLASDFEKQSLAIERRSMS